jgi:hypothetical protein
LGRSKRELGLKLVDLIQAKEGQRACVIVCTTSVQLMNVKAMFKNICALNVSVEVKRTFVSGLKNLCMLNCV